MNLEQSKAAFLQALPAYTARHGIKSICPPPDAAALARFEREFGFPIPSELREWLSLINGGTPEEILSVEQFLPLRGRDRRGDEPEDLVDLVRIYKRPPDGGYPKRTIPIGGDGCGNDYVLVPVPLNPTGEGWWVAFSDHGETTPGTVSYYCASNLWRFLSGIFEEKPWVETDDPMNPPPSWPFDRELTLAFDPGMRACPARQTPWNREEGTPDS